MSNSDKQVFNPALKEPVKLTATVEPVAEARTREFQYEEPVHLQKLIDAEWARNPKITIDQIGALLGMSGTHVSQVMIGKSKWRSTYELAALAVLEARHGKTETTKKTYIVQVSGEDAKTFEKMVRSIDGAIVGGF